MGVWVPWVQTGIALVGEGKAAGEVSGYKRAIAGA